MNMKVIIMSTLISALLAGTSAMADFFPDDGVVTEKINYQSPLVIRGDDIVLSGRKSVADNETTYSSVERKKVSYQSPSIVAEDTGLSGRK